jgi:hypothetical protein
MPQQVVSSGAITLPYAASTVQVGLPITADLITAPASTQQDATLGQSRVKNLSRAWVRVYNSGLFSVGPNASKLTPIKSRHFEAPGSPPVLMTDEIPLFILPNFNPSGQIMIRQSDPLPLTVVDVTVEVAMGG